MDKMSGRRLHHGKTRLTDQICIDLIDNRNETKHVPDFDNCPVEENGGKSVSGIRQHKILRDKFAYLERTCDT